MKRPSNHLLDLIAELKRDRDDARACLKTVNDAAGELRAENATYRTELNRSDLAIKRVFAAASTKGLRRKLRAVYEAEMSKHDDGVPF